MNIVFRVDSSSQMGVGHLMRCLTLADELKKQNHNATFICRELKGNLIKLIEHRVLILPVDKDFQSDDLYLSWLGATQEQDAKQTIQVIHDNVDLLVVDSYALDEAWHKQLEPHTKKIIVIDDLADRQFNCDILLNQNLGSHKDDYKNKVPKDCKLLLGCEYALLRSEFSKLRSQALEKRKNTKEIKNILISMGGSDRKNLTYNILQNINDSFNITVVLGALSLHIDMIRQYAKDKNIKVIVNANNMAELMLEADLSIGASGSTNWERLCLGLPSLIFTVAENQIKFSKILDELGLIRLLGHVGERKTVNVTKESILSIDDLSAWSERCFNSCSCNGASKVVGIITSKSVSII